MLFLGGAGAVVEPTLVSDNKGLEGYVCGWVAERARRVAGWQSTCLACTETLGSIPNTARLFFPCDDTHTYTHTHTQMHFFLYLAVLHCVCVCVGTLEVKTHSFLEIPTHLLSRKWQGSQNCRALQPVSTRCLKWESGL